MAGSEALMLEGMLSVYSKEQRFQSASALIELAPFSFSVNNS